MNYAGFNVHAHNRATRRYGGKTGSELTPIVMTTCPVCMANVAYHDNRLKHHLEHCGFTICEASGYSLSAAQAMLDGAPAQEATA